MMQYSAGSAVSLRRKKTLGSCFSRRLVYHDFASVACASRTFACTPQRFGRTADRDGRGERDSRLDLSHGDDASAHGKAQLEPNDSGPLKINDEFDSSTI